MFLAIDIGNTHTVFGIFDRKALKAEWRMTSSQQKTEDEVGMQLLAFLHQFKINPRAVNGIGISSVVPDLTDTYVVMGRKYFRHEPVVVGAALDLGFRIHYDDPSQVGADRLCNAIAGFAKHGGPLIIIDFGTATTFDIVASNGDYLGGVISPGVETAAADLHRRAAKLPRVELHFPKKIIGTDTVSSMQAGILYGALDAMEGMVKRLQAEIRNSEGKTARVIATGGFSRLMMLHSTLIEAHEPALVLEGVRMIHERVRRQSRRR
jgi:type III pantothenate kinase